MDSARAILKVLGSYDGGRDPHGQMDQAIVDRINVLATKQDLSASDVKRLLDDCVSGSRCTDFVVAALNAVWVQMR